MAKNANLLNVHCTVFMESWARGRVECSGFGFYDKKENAGVMAAKFKSKTLMKKENLNFLSYSGRI